MDRTGVNLPMNVIRQLEDLRCSIVKYESEFQQVIVDWNTIIFGSQLKKDSK